MAENGTPSFPFAVEAFVSTLASISATQGDAGAVAVLATSVPAIFFSDSRSDWGSDYYYFELRLLVSSDLYGRLGSEREALCSRLGSLAVDVSRAYDPLYQLTTVSIAPTVQEIAGWRVAAEKWLRGEGISNQGRARSDNIASRVHDGLLFRSQPEIYLYDALKAHGVYLAPLPVFVRGGVTYQRLEPDFVIIHKGVLTIVEVDGATVHRESAVEAHERTRGLQREGVNIERVKASDCMSRAAADKCAAALLAAIDQYKALR